MALFDLDGFDEFWQAYPNKKAKGDARKAWGQVKAAGRLPVILAALTAQQAERDRKIAARQWVPSSFPFPATWLRAERWDDQPEAEPTALAPPSAWDKFEDRMGGRKPS